MGVFFSRDGRAVLRTVRRSRMVSLSLVWISEGSLGLSGCQSPSQVSVELSTDANCVDLSQVQLSVGKLKGLEGFPPTAVSDTCDDKGRIGNIVIVPSDNKSAAFAVKVVVGVGESTEACLANNYKGGCIVARRAHNFQPHHPLHLPIKLEVNCIDIPCDATETCRGGTCVSAALADLEKCADPVGCDAIAAGGSSRLLTHSSDGGTTSIGGTASMSGAG